MTSNAGKRGNEIRKPGVLLTNLGSPAAPTASAVRSYLRQFLADRFVIDAPRVRWWLIRHLFILPARPRRVAAAYRAVWTEEGAPLLRITRQQAAALRRVLRQRLSTEVQVEVGMRYGQPSLARAVRTLTDGGCDRVLLFPLYPQYSATTVGSTFDAMAAELTRFKTAPETRFVAGYARHDGYITALADSIRELWDRDGQCDRLMLSFHGLPKRYGDLGDPYPEQCQTTAERLADRLGLDADRWTLAFQSRFGRQPWIRPYTDETLASWGQQNIDSVDVVCPGFAADCLETLEEIAIAGRREFEAAGGGRFRYIPALNDREDHIRAIADIAILNLRGWVKAVD